MDTKLKAKWIEALRSGEYQQGQSMLHDPDTNSFCCLGVLCMAIGAVFTEVQIEKGDGEGFYMSTLDNAPVLDGRALVDGDGEELSAAFCKEIGISDQAHLIMMNDGRGGSQEDENYIAAQPFSVIADYIEQNL